MRSTFNGQFVIRTEKIAALDGAPPKRFMVGFDSAEKDKRTRLGTTLRRKRKSTTFA
jgi:hypothetical protein